MKQREEDKIKPLILPKRTRDTFSREEVELMVTLSAKKYKAQDIATMLNEKFGSSRSPGGIQSKLWQIKKKGIPGFKEPEVVVDYELPDSASQLLKQLEVAVKILLPS